MLAESLLKLALDALATMTRNEKMECENSFAAMLAVIARIADKSPLGQPANRRSNLFAPLLEIILTSVIAGASCKIRDAWAIIVTASELSERWRIAPAIWKRRGFIQRHPSRHLSVAV